MRKRYGNLCSGLLRTALAALVVFVVMPLAANASVYTARGTLNAPTVIGNQSITVGFQPKAVIFYWAHGTADGYQTGGYTGYGFTDGTRQGVVAVASDDAVGTSNIGSTTRTDSVISILSNGTPTVDAQASIVSLDANGFTINWSNAAGSAWNIHYLVVGGSEITNAYVGNFSRTAATGNLAVTGTGFQPDFVMMLAPEYADALNATSTGAAFSLGMMTPTEQQTLGFGLNQDGVATTRTNSGRQITTAALSTMYRGTEDGQASYASMDTNGFTLNWTNAPTGTVPVLYLALKGGSYDLGATNQRTTVGTTAVTGVPFQPKGVMLFSYNNAASTTVNTGTGAGKISIGASTVTSEGAIWMQDADGVTTTDANRATVANKAIRLATNAATTNAEADVNSFDANGFTLGWTTVDATAREVLYWAIGTTCVDATPSTITVAAGQTANGNPYNVSGMKSSTGNVGTFEYMVTKPSSLTVSALDAWKNLLTSTTSTTATYTTATTGTTTTFTVSAGTNRLTLAGFCLEASANATISAADVRLDSSTGTPFTEITRTTGLQRELCWVGYLNDSQVTTGTHDIYLSTTQSAGLVGGVHIWAGTYQYVDQTTPITAFAANNPGSSTIPFGANVAYDASSMTFYLAAGGNTHTAVTQPTGFTPVANSFGTDHSTAVGQISNAGSGTHASTLQVALTGGTTTRGAIVVASLNPAAGTTVCTNWTATASIPASTAGGSLCGDYVNLGTYILTARGNDPECGGSVVASSPTNFTWNSCSETGTLTAPAPAAPIVGPVTVTAGGTATGKQVSWSTDGGTSWSAWVASGSTFTPTTCISGNAIFRAQGTGSCGTLSAQSVAIAVDTLDKDLATLTVTGPASPVSGIKTVQVQVGAESAPATLSAMVVDIANAGACNVNNGFMSWNGAASRWEYSWDTSVCGTGSVLNGVTIIASATDPDCGNNVTSPTATVSIDNTCIPTAGTVSWTPPGGTVTTPIVVTATLTGSATGPAEVSFDNGSSWLPNGSTYTPRADGQGTETFQVRAFSNCGLRIYGGPYVVTYDGRVPRIRPLNVTAAALGKTSIQVIMNYCSDKNNNAQTTLRYKLTSAPDLPANWTTVGPVIDGQAGDADGTLNQYVKFMLTSLTTDTSYDLQLTVTDADGVDWTTIGGSQPWTATLALSSWIDSNIMHNALRFACSKIGYADETACVAAGGTWNLDRKWAGGWGLPNSKPEYATAQYDSFECSTCHVKNSSNVKRVITAVTPKADGPFPGSAVNLQNLVEGSADFGDDSGGHATSNRVCEVCHSQTTYHRQNTAGQANLAHNNKTDCIRCHEHTVGFRASCDSCHGTPPVDAAGLVTGADATGSTAWGEHQKHAVDIGYDCKTCHDGWDGTGQMPNAGNINIGIKPSVNAALFAGAVNPIDTGNSYEGRPAPGGKYTGTFTQGTAAADMSCAVYCHGSRRPVWNPTSTQPCGSCHGEVNSGVGYRSGAPTGVGDSRDLAGSLTGLQVGKHGTHLDDSVYQTGDPCALCHDGFSYVAATHVNGTVNVKMKQAAKLGAPGTTGGAGVTAVYNSALGTCTNMECHGDTPWNSTAVLNCTQSCHNYPPVGVTAGYSTYSGGIINPVTHVTPNGTQYLKDNHGQCLYCHGWNDNGSGSLPITGMTAAQLTAMNGDPAEAANFTTYANPANLIGQHMDGTITMNGESPVGDGIGTNDAGYDPTNGGCDNAVCHGNDAAHQFIIPGGINSPLKAADIGPGDCGACHTTGVGGATIVTPTSPHTKATKNGTYTGCGTCHSGHYTSAGGVQIPNNATIGINYAGAQHGGIKLGGPNTHTSIELKTTEAEICWGCHDAMGTASVKKATITFTATTIVDSGAGLGVFTANKPLKVAGSSVAANNKWVTPTAVAAGTLTFPAATFTADATAGEMISLQESVTEWGMNTKQAGTSPVPTQYDLGTLSTSNWTTATWSSGKGATFAYKTGAIQSTHAANAAGTSAVSGAIYAKTETKDTVANLRCSYCHDVHDAIGPNGPPYLRGTWWSNPYDEDGAPQAGQVYNNILEYGAVPRGGQSATVQQRTLGGFWIDINNVRPGTATTTALSGVAYANPTATGGTGTGGAWTLADSAGLCVLCHGNNVNTMDQTTDTALWFSTNGHANAVIGGSGAGAANIFELRGGVVNTINPTMHFKGNTEPGDVGTKVSYRNGSNSVVNYTPSINAVSENTIPYAVELWGTMTYDTTTTNSLYHKFSCSKCHNPHASRLPKLMITNCLDTKHNTWDDSYQLNTQSATSINYNRSISNWSSAQNCHRVGAIIPADRKILANPTTGGPTGNGLYAEPVDTGAVAAPAGTAADYQNRGWNTVTPW